VAHALALSPPPAIPQAASGNTCPANYVNVKRGQTDTPTTNQVQFSALRSLGWDVDIQQPSWTTSDDFYSVNCNGFGNVQADRVSCTSSAPGVPVGETHLRHDCPSKELWVLVYTYSDFIFSTVSAGSVLLSAPDSCCSACRG
jgi:hypothetical protein